MGIATVAVLLALGCATAERAHAPTPADAPGEVLVTAAPGTPELAFEPLAGHGALSATGAGLTMLGDCLVDVFSSSTCSGPFCGAAVLVAFGICGGAALIATGAEATAAPRRAEVAQAMRKFLKAVERQAAQDALREQVALNIERRGEEFLSRLSAAVEQQYRRTGDLGRLDAAGVGAVLETDLKRAELVRIGRDNRFLLTVHARARLLRAGDGAELYYGQFIHGGGRYTAAHWSENGSRRLMNGLAAAYESLGAQIFDSALRNYPFPDAGAHAAGALSLAFGLAPLEPATRGQLSGDDIIGPLFEWTKVDSLRPELRWQAFPRAGDARAAPEEMARVRNVRYDLVIAGEDRRFPAQVVYRRDGIATPSHRLESPLQPDSRYFWSVRASFDLDGRRRVTDWSSVRAQTGETLTVPHRDMFRFRTPG
jgi:hypothetical protein